VGGEGHGVPRRPRRDTRASLRGGLYGAGANGDFLRLGSLKNKATRATTLVGNVATGSAFVVQNPDGGSALELQVGQDAALLKVNP
jgi:hypothetical protein